jgi:hypothetical protein
MELQLDLVGLLVFKAVTRVDQKIYPVGLEQHHSLSQQQMHTGEILAVELLNIYIYK